jgi:hypothetical protein
MRAVNKAVSARRMILCAGLQSGGTTLVSWCFLQRQDTNGVLDMDNDVIRTSFEEVKEPVLWVKQTIGSFQWLDVYETFRDLGWQPEPLLVVRDVRAAYSSLLNKSYGINGTTAEDPPLRMRFRRFLRDWELFRANAWPIIKFEDFIRKPRTVLMSICKDLSLPWDEGMLSWPKQLSEIAYVRRGGVDVQVTFKRSLERGCMGAAKLPDKAEIRIQNLPKSELRWLEGTFSTYNSFHDYPQEIRPTLQQEMPKGKTVPCFEGTTREWYYSEIQRLRGQYWKLMSDNERLRKEIDESLGDQGASSEKSKGPPANKAEQATITAEGDGKRLEGE